jgi:hypothetical protein
MNTFNLTICISILFFSCQNIQQESQLVTGNIDENKNLNISTSAIDSDVKTNCQNEFKRNATNDSVGIYRTNDKIQLASFKVDNLFWDSTRNILFIIDYSDFEFYIFDLCQNKVITSFMLKNREVKSVFSKTNGNYLIVLFENGIETVWSVEMELERLFFLDITPKDIDGIILDNR